uniref:RING-type domain-containing protein n=1 Tax=Caenorhabditis tropicalis TaxID=1561998 RepID=A0A1I7TKG4_9PELO
MISSSGKTGIGNKDLELTCPVCQEEYDDQLPPYIAGCGHTMCKGCIAHMKTHASQHGTQMSCPTCRKPCDQENIPKNFKLAEVISAIKNMRINDAPENPVKCTACSKIDNESDMFVCRNCIKDFYNYDVIGTINPDIELDVQTLALCGSCAIRDHVSVDHETVSYFPISSALHFESQLTSVALLREELQQQVGKVNEWFSHFGTTVHKFNMELNKMTEMIRTSKSSSVQQEFTERMKESVQAMSNHVQKVADSVSSSEMEYKEVLMKLVNDNKKDETSKCRESPERKTETVCIECNSKQPGERFFCCKMCFEDVKGLIEDLLDTSKIDAVDITTLPFCPNCVLNFHIGEKHQTVKFEVVQNKYITLKRLAEAEKQKDSLIGKFSGLMETFKHYADLILSYEDKILKMSKITLESRLHPDHEQIIEGFQNTLNQAETVIVGMQSNTEINKMIIEENKIDTE